MAPQRSEEHNLERESGRDAVKTRCFAARFGPLSGNPLSAIGSAQTSTAGIHSSLIDVVGGRSDRLLRFGLPTTSRYHMWRISYIFDDTLYSMQPKPPKPVAISGSQIYDSRYYFNLDHAH